MSSSGPLIRSMKQLLMNSMQGFLIAAISTELIMKDFTVSIVKSIRCFSFHFSLISLNNSTMKLDCYNMGNFQEFTIQNQKFDV